MRRIVSNLSLSGLSPKDIDAVLVTHEHSDHVGGLSMLIKHHALSIFAPAAVARALVYRGCCGEDDIAVLPAGESVHFGDVTVSSFRTSHDTIESVGYRFEHKEECFAFATDTGCVTETVYRGLLGAQAVLIESNHDTDMLLAGPYPYQLKRRILSDRGHLSNAACACLAARLAEEGCKCFVLGHLSRENNTPALAFDEVRRALGEREVQLFIAPEAERLSIELGGEKLW